MDASQLLIRSYARNFCSCMFKLWGLFSLHFFSKLIYHGFHWMARKVGGETSSSGCQAHVGTTR